MAKTSKECDIEHILNRDMSEFSGGELQKVFIAMVIIQDTKILVLDEPTTHLDIKYRFEILELIKKLNKTKNITVVLVLHNMNLACKYSDKLLMIKNGQVIAEGVCDDVINEDVLNNAYDVKSIVLKVNGESNN